MIHGAISWSTPQRDDRQGRVRLQSRHFSVPSGKSEGPDLRRLCFGEGEIDEMCSALNRLGYPAWRRNRPHQGWPTRCVRHIIIKKKSPTKRNDADIICLFSPVPQFLPESRTWHALSLNLAPASKVILLPATSPSSNTTLAVAAKAALRCATRVNGRRRRLSIAHPQPVWLSSAKNIEEGWDRAWLARRPMAEGVPIV